MSMKKLAISAAVAAVTTVSAAAQAEMFWSDNSASYLMGNDYKLPLSGDDVNGAPDTSESRYVLTFEHASGHSWGDVFFFADRSQSKDGSEESEIYSELGARISSGVVMSDKLAFGPVTDVLLAGQLEMGSASNGGKVNNQLLGLGFDFKVPGFDYFQLNTYYRFNGDSAYREFNPADYSFERRDVKNNFQLTPVWGTSFNIGSARFVWDGFADITTDADVDDVAEQKGYVHIQTQLKWDAGKLLMNQEKKLYLGVEYEYWSDKFGVEDGSDSDYWAGGKNDTTESNIQLLVKYHL
ncbi:nucleoside-specific outer membrane channel protein Tsx [Sinobacterium caligoides]|uniref:Nucleoside-specific outer membrane channel protein Tsx n=1 Tax=Sinobacterium caligoides TaxID=933926 RepID=A0A3N2E0J8_9GAMM|nr:outer membrane protein OmpK [Sinobacterium caligoides]ROS05633.1 nucleoside-specific outer membrane channel protein Tsx [Sinobacterium caligoides]